MTTKTAATEILHTDSDGDRLAVYGPDPENRLTLSVLSDSGEVYVPATVVAAIRATLKTPDVVPLLLDREDLEALSRILTGERYQMDKGDGTPVPQPRWATNVRISKAVDAALAVEG